MRDALAQARQQLAAAGDTEADVAATILLRRALGWTAAQLAANRRLPMPPDAAERFQPMIARRARGEPVAYIVGEWPFHQITLKTDQRALIPRPETELLVDWALAQLDTMPADARVVDVGTGSGAIALALLTARPRLRLTAVDLSLDALGLARENAARLGCDPAFVWGDLLTAVRGPVDLIVANLPYIPTAAIATLDRAVRDFEPRLALDGGEDGLELLERLLAQGRSALAPTGALGAENGADQGRAARQLAAQHITDWGIYIIPDHAQNERCVVIARRAQSEQTASRVGLCTLPQP
ncbi:MAG: peptide chain release factor N(5)-glutamine methyltransferase [Dehalococcoidia bacterium]|nr:peptide chain release factor N(5)-glutamine methyltransferase [Dehalococcoidia bacterium]